MSSRTTIGVLNCRVRLPAGATGGDAGHIDSLARRRLPAMLSDRLSAAGADDPRIVVARSLTLRSRLTGWKKRDDSFCDRWADGLAQGLISLAGNEPSSSSEVRVFSDRADWIAACLQDLLGADRADPPWWHGPLGSTTRGKRRAEAVAALLESEPQLLAPILADLDRRGQLAQLLDILPPRVQASLLADADVRNGPADALARDRQRPILAAALALLGLRRSQAQREVLLRRWLTQDTATPDWQSPRALADAVLAACRFIAQASSEGRHALFRTCARGRDASTELDWLDRDRLHTGLAALTADPASVGTLPAMIARSFASVLDDANEPPDRLALRAVARMAVAQPDLAGTAAARRAFRLAAPVALRFVGLPDRERSAALRAYDEGQGPLADANARTDRASRRMIAAVLHALARTGVSAASPALANDVASDCAGVAILARAMSDVNLAQALAIARTQAPSLPRTPAMLAAALLCCWAGPAAVDRNGRIDAGLRMLLDGQGPDHADDLAAALAAIDPRDAVLLADTVHQAIAVRRPAGAADPVSSDDLATLQGPARLGLDPVFGRMAGDLLVNWAGWLNGFERSSCGWLLGRAVRRPGRLVPDGDVLSITLLPLPLDVALRGAGYLEPFAPPSWMRWRRIVFIIEGRDR